MDLIRILVVSSCTGEKKFKTSDDLVLDDFQNPARLERKKENLKRQGYEASAIELYTGPQHLYVSSAINLLKSTFSAETVGFKIISAGYGLIDEEDKIVPYEVTFNTFRLTELDLWSRALELRENLEQTVSDYDLIFILLGERYLRALNLPIKSRPEQTFIFLASQQGERYIPNLEAQVFKLLLSNAEARHFGCALVSLKGFLFKRFAHTLETYPEYLEKVYQCPEFFQSIINQHPETAQLSLPLQGVTTLLKSRQARPARVSLNISGLAPAPNLHFGLQYYMPEYDDLVDPNYNFLTDSYDLNRNSYADQVYAHEIYDKPNYDGLLVSKVVIEGKVKKKKLMQKSGVHQYLRFPGRKIMADCGAFGYIAKEVPPYETEEILEFYDQLGFDYGVSIDHLIVGPFAEAGIREKRYELTIKNAEDFLRLHRQRSYRFTPIGAVQGWAPDIYAEAVKAYISMGYDYIGLGGMVRSSNEVIFEILKAVSPHLTPQTRLHLFGVARLEAVEAFHYLGVTSMDSASPLRKAWLGSVGSAVNYHTLSGKKYTAIRVPPVNRYGRKAQNAIALGVATEETLKDLERRALQALRDFEAGRLTVEGALSAVLEYDEILASGGLEDLTASKIKQRNLQRDLYRELLEERPWRRCECKICQSIGIDVVMFRNSNRNRRRGFHNTYVFYKNFRERIPAQDNG